MPLSQLWFVKFRGLLVIFLLLSTQVQGQQRGREGAILDCSNEQGLHYRDAIPSINQPTFEDVTSADSYLKHDERVIGVLVDGKPVAYPVRILNRHEVVNDQIHDIAVTYCPITGSGLIYPSNELGGSNIGVTGYLFESNLVFYDHDTDSCFVQMISTSVSGELLGTKLSYLPTIDTTWETWKHLFPESAILSRDSGFDHSFYEVDAYEKYSSDNSLLYPSNYLEDEPYNLYHPKVPTTVVEYNGSSVLLPHTDIGRITQFGNLTALYDGSLMRVYRTNLEGRVFNINYNNKYIDQFGNEWNIMGRVVDGPDLGLELVPYPSFRSYWYAAIVFFPNSVIVTSEGSMEFEVRQKDPNISLLRGGQLLIPVVLAIVILLFSVMAFRRIRSRGN